MNTQLDQLVERLAAAPADHRLDHLEAQVSRGVAGLRARERVVAVLAPIRVASVGLALAMGLTVGGVSTASSFIAPHLTDGFAMTVDLAPSTLLGRP